MYAEFIMVRKGNAHLPLSSQSTSLNTSRLKVLQARNDHLEQLFEDAGKDVKELGSSDKYAKALEAFILEASQP
jgi:vacuolar-type H+-ATPase subunit E/Vma4